MDYRKLISLICAAVLLFSLTACSKDVEDGEQVHISSSDSGQVANDGGIISLANIGGSLSYKAERLELPAELERLIAFAYKDNILYVCGQEDGDGVEISSIYSVNLDTDYTRRLDYSEPRTAKQIRSMGIDKDSKLWVLESSAEYIISSEGSTVNSDETFMLIRFSTSGEIEATIDIDGINPTKLLIYDEYICVVSSDNTLVILDSTGSILSEVNLAQNSSLAITDSGIAAGNATSDGYDISLLNLETKSFDSVIGFDAGIKRISGGGGCVFLDDGNRLYRYGLDTAECELLLSWMGVGLFGNYSELFAMPDDGILYCALDGVSVLSAALAEEGESGNAEHIEESSGQNNGSSIAQDTGGTIILATMWADGIKHEVLAFNASNDNYTIEIKDYSEHNTNENSQEGLTRLRTEIIAGNVPDIIDLTDIPYDMYDNNDLLADLMPFLENDNDFSVPDCEPAALNAMMTGGKLYNFIPEFSVLAVFGNASDIAGNNIDSFSDLLSIIRKPDEFLSVQTRSDIIKYAIGSSNSRFYNFETGECYFDTNEFIDFLEFAKTQPDDYRSLRFNFNDTPSGSLRFFYTSFSGIPQGIRYRFQGEDIGMVGLPSSHSNGALINSDAHGGFGMTSASQLKNGVWEFMKFLVSDGYLENYRTSSYNIRKSVNDYNEQEYRNLINSGDGKITYQLGSQVIDISPDLRDIDLSREILGSVSGMYRYYEGLYNIVMEDASSFFAGAITAEDAARVIQSRASIYMSERR